MFFKKVYYEPDIENYELGKILQNKYKKLEWIPIENHNNIEELRKNPNTAFREMKHYLIIGTRKTHQYRPNEKSSDFLVPFTSSGCSAMCLYCYLVCNYNKCSYMRIFVNREKMMEKLIRTALKSEKELTFEIGSNSDLVLENTITSNLPWIIEEFGKQEKGYITFPTKFSMVEPILNLNHRGRTIVRVSLNPVEIITEVELGTSSLEKRLEALNKLYESGYQVGILIAPVIFMDNWQQMYQRLIKQIWDGLPPKLRKTVQIEIIFMTYSYIHRAINTEAFSEARDLYDKEIMTGRGRGKYTYKNDIRQIGEIFFRCEIGKYFDERQIVYIV